MQGFNMGRYVPPDVEGTTSGNALHKKHPLGARARHLKTTGALIVRFEMPFAVWCTTCTPHETLIGQGVRFNAEKKKVGHYYSTPVYSFRMKHAACGGWIEIRTDPQNTEYVVVEGGRRRDVGMMDSVGGEIVVGTGQSKADAFARLEGKVDDKRQADEARDRIWELQSRQMRDWEDPYEQSRRLRRSFREVRKGLERKEAETQTLKDKLSLGIEVLEESEADRVRARMVEFGDARSGDRRAMRLKPLFADAHSAPPARVGDAAEQRKAVLRSELRGNTRAVVDPFLSSDASEWRPESKRRKVVAESRPGEEARGSSATPENHGKPVGTAPLASAALVDYASDSD
ncbi:Saf4/Yju2 family protein [Aspergillus saccharolyticus JOP 1030-1]|uniref:DUF572-domain-containing protein n=1 Tax=Aspergillus saccharolyticus JOP 1030-1 TaxID=1450539 RepID=A0A319AB42_9EURO|nr:DUF572-domain-containing protein [Aspergillus saccharolyticus JOP 1030-1]PYH44162.1 DUF572-domain-containing protein [Aspergillus saccharolyticus JOP 1030-1]